MISKIINNCQKIKCQIRWDADRRGKKDRQNTDIADKLLDLSGQLLKISRKVGGKKKEKRAGLFWAGQKEVIFMDGLGAVNLKPEWLLKMEPAWLGMTLPEFSTPINGRLVSVCIATLSVCIYIAITAISFIASSSKWRHAFWQFDIFNVWTWSEEGTLASPAILPVCILSPSSFRCIVPAHFLQATAFQHCKPVRGAHCKDVVPIASKWCPLQTCGAHCKLVVAIANLWSQFGAHCKRPIVQQESVRPGLRQNWNLMRYIWTCTSTYTPHRGFSWYRGKPIEQDWHARLTFFIHTQLNLKELGDKNKMIQLMLIGGQHIFSMYSAGLG